MKQITSTGYVRRDARAAMKVNPWNRLDEKFYTMMRTAFRGGNTHCNGDMTGQILDDVASYDLASSYDEIFEAALKESYKPVKKRRSRKKT